MNPSHVSDCPCTWRPHVAPQERFTSIVVPQLNWPCFEDASRASSCGGLRWAASQECASEAPEVNSRCNRCCGVCSVGRRSDRGHLEVRGYGRERPSIWPQLSRCNRFRGSRGALDVQIVPPTPKAIPAPDRGPGSAALGLRLCVGELAIRNHYSDLNLLVVRKSLLFSFGKCQDAVGCECGGLCSWARGFSLSPGCGGALSSSTACCREHSLSLTRTLLCPTLPSQEKTPSIVHVRTSRGNRMSPRASHGRTLWLASYQDVAR